MCENVGKDCLKQLHNYIKHFSLYTFYMVNNTTKFNEPVSYFNNGNDVTASLFFICLFVSNSAQLNNWKLHFGSSTSVTWYQFKNVISGKISPDIFILLHRRFQRWSCSVALSTANSRVFVTF